MTISSSINENRHSSVTDRLALALYLTLLILAIGEMQTALPISLLHRNLILGALTGLLLTRFLGVLISRRLNWLVSDIVFALWLVWELLAPLFGRPQFAVVEGLREVLLAVVAFDVGASVVYRHRRLSWTLIISIVICAATYGLIRPDYFVYPALAAPLLALALFGGIMMLSDRSWRPMSRKFFKITLGLSAIGLIAGYCLLGQFQLRENERQGGMALRLRQQDAFVREQTAKQLFVGNTIRGIGRNNFAWHVQARHGESAVSPPAFRSNRLTNPVSFMHQHEPSAWPHLAQLGVVSLFLLLLIYFIALSFSTRLFSLSSSLPNGLRIVSPQNQAARVALFVWLITGFLGTFLFTSLGMLITFLLAGILRGQKQDWRQRALRERQMMEETERELTPSAAENAGVQTSSEKKRQVLRKLSWAMCGTVFVIFFACLVALPEITVWIIQPSDEALTLEQGAKRINLARKLYPLTPDPLVREVQLVQLQFEDVGMSKLERDRITNLLYQALELNPLDARLHLQLADWLQLENRESAARSQLEQGLSDCPGSLQIAIRLAQCYERQAKVEEALACLEPFLITQPGELELLEIAHSLALRLNQPTRAEQLNRQITQLRSWRKGL